jgi:hypothetical protein
MATRRDSGLCSTLTAEPDAGIAEGPGEPAAREPFSPEVPVGWVGGATHVGGATAEHVTFAAVAATKLVTFPGVVWAAPAFVTPTAVAVETLPAPHPDETDTAHDPVQEVVEAAAWGAMFEVAEGAWNAGVVWGMNEATLTSRSPSARPPTAPAKNPLAEPVLISRLLRSR